MTPSDIAIGFQKKIQEGPRRLKNETWEWEGDEPR